MADRQEFSKAQKNAAKDRNAEDVAQRWPEEFKGKEKHYMCEECGFVGTNREEFHADHVVACASGGSNDRHSEEIVERMSGSNPDPAFIFQTGVNIRVLCEGCNLARWKHTFVPSGRGFAYSRPGDDLNPDHLYAGVPRR